MVHFVGIGFVVSLFGGLQAPGGISFFFSSNFPSNAVRIMSGDAFLIPVMTIFIKNKFWRKGGREEGRKEGREEGRKGGREEGRKGGREEGRKHTVGTRGAH